MSTEMEIELQETDPVRAIEPDPAPAPANQYPSGARFILTVLALALTIFLAALDGTIVAVAIPSITHHFDSIANVAVC